MTNNSSLPSCNETDHFLFLPPSAFDKFTGVLLIIIIIVSIFGNSLVCYAFIVNPRLRIVTNYFIVNLAISDILTSALAISFDVDSRLHGATHWKYGETMCTIWTTMYTISVPTSVLTLCVVSTDRYKAISDPLAYRTRLSFNTTKAIFIAIFIWILTIFLAFLPAMVGPPLNITLTRNQPGCPSVFFCYFQMSGKYSAGLSLTVFILPSIVMTALYIKMYRIISKRDRHLTEESVVSHTSASTDSRHHRPNRSFQNHYQTKVARHFAVIILLQLVCWYPYTIVSIVYNLCDTCIRISSSAFYFLLAFGYSSCAINPYLYAYQQRSFRQVFNKMIRGKNM